MRRLIKNFVAKIFDIKQCQCPPDMPTPAESISSDLPIEPIKITSTNSWGINEIKKTDKSRGIISTELTFICL